MNLCRDVMHGLELARRSGGEAGLDRVDPDSGELLRDAELVARRD